MTSAPFCAPQLNCSPVPFIMDPALLTTATLPGTEGRITEEGDLRITEEGDTRVLE